jgi:hypothetical protein
MPVTATARQNRPRGVTINLSHPGNPGTKDF